MKKLLIAMGLALAFAAPAFADTPMGPGVTGMGGTGPNKSDPDTGAKPGGAGVQRPEAREPISGNAKAERSVTKDDAPRSVTHPTVPEATGATGGAAGRGRVDPTPSGSTGAR